MHLDPFGAEDRPASDRTDLDHPERHDESPRPGREGLPKRFAMRHTRHYVDELLGEAPLRTVREIPVSEIEPPTDEALNLESLEESVRLHGIIEPLLVARRAADYRVIAGMRRLRAARTVGLNTVPCLVQEVDDERLLALRGAVLDRITVTAPVIVTESQESEELSAFPSDADLESPSTGEADDIAAGLRTLVDDEIESVRRLRAKITSAASDILSRQELPDRALVSFQDLMTASVDAVAGEARLRGVSVEIEGPGGDFRMPLDAPRWMTSITGLLQAMISKVDRPGAVCRITATVTVLRPALLLNCAVEQPQPAPALDDAAIARYFDPAWTSHPCGESGAIALAALAKTARAHGGRVQVRDNGAVLVVVPRPLD